MIKLHGKMLSSANKVNLRKLLQLGKLLLKIINYRGPKIDLRGTP